MNAYLTIITLILACTGIARSEEDVAFFGLAKGPAGAKAAALLNPMLPDGISEIRFGDSNEELIAKRANHPTKKWITVGQLVTEELELEARKPKSLFFYDFRYGHSADKHLDSVQMETYYDDDTAKFPQLKSLLSANFQSFGKPLRVITVKEYGSDKTPGLFTYWKNGEYEIELWLIRSFTRNRMNLRWVARIPHSDEKHFPPTNGEVFTPDAAEFAKLFDKWFNETTKR